MTRAELLDKLSKILGEIVEDDNLRLTEATTADDVADWDSTNHVRFLVAIESEMGFRFETAEIGMLQNVGQLMDLVESKMKGR
jgi:acyl carrier protein